MATYDFMGGLGNALFPTTPGVDLQTAQAMQRQAMLAFGLGMLGAGSRPGATLGSSLYEGYQGASQTYAGAMNNAFRSQMLSNEMERQAKADEREEKRFEREQKLAEAETRTRRGDVATRVSAGLGAAQDKVGYWNLVSRDPEVQAALQQAGITAPVDATPEQLTQFGQQLGSFGQVAGPRLTPRDIELRAVVDPSTGQQVLLPEAQAIGLQPGYAPVAPTGQLTSMDLPGGMKQNVIFDPRARTTTPVGDPFKEASQTKPTGENQAAAGFYSRMTNAEGLLGKYSPGLTDYMAYGSVIGGNAVTSAAANKAMSKEGQKYYQAASDWVRAKLRKESGAQIPPDEMIQEIRTYFPVPGDSEEVIAQKARARQIAIEAMYQSAGPAVRSDQNPRMPAEIFPSDSPEAIEAEMRRRGLLK